MGVTATPSKGSSLPTQSSLRAPAHRRRYLGVVPDAGPPKTIGTDQHTDEQRHQQRSRYGQTAPERQACPERGTGLLAGQCFGPGNLLSSQCWSRNLWTVCVHAALSSWRTNDAECQYLQRKPRRRQRHTDSRPRCQDVRAPPSAGTGVSALHVASAGRAPQAGRSHGGASLEVAARSMAHTPGRRRREACRGQPTETRHKLGQLQAQVTREQAASHSREQLTRARRSKHVHTPRRCATPDASARRAVTGYQGPGWAQARSARSSTPRSG